MTLPFQPCPNVAELVPSYSIPDGDIANNVFHVLTSGTWTVDNLTALCNTYITWEDTVATSNKPRDSRSTTCSLVSVKARDLTTATSPEVTISPSGGPLAGTASGAPANNGLSLAVKLGTGLVGRSNRGRVFWIGMAAAAFSTDTNLVLSAFGVSMVNYYAALRVAIHAANDHWDLSVLSRYNSDDVPAPPHRRASGVATPVANVSVVDGFIDFQRRRAPGHARHS